MDDTLGIDCPKVYFFGQDTPCRRRMSADFEDGIIGHSPPKKKFKVQEYLEESFGPTTRSRSTPRRSGRLRKKGPGVLKLFTTSSTTPTQVTKTSQATKKFQPRPAPKLTSANVIRPKPNRTLELRRQAALNKNKPVKQSNAAVMKPQFQKPKLYCTVPKTPEMVRRLKAQIKRPVIHKSFKDKENEEVEKMKKFKFRAAPVPKTGKRDKPINPHVRSGKLPTKAVTPKITQAKKRKREEDAPTREFKAQPVPHFSRRSVVVKKEHKIVDMQPFSFDKRYADPSINKKKLIADQLQKLREMTEFKATPYYGPSVPKENRKPAPKTTTIAKPKFELPGEAISRKKQEAFQRKIQKEKELLRAKASNFRASSVRGRAHTAS